MIQNEAKPIVLTTSYVQDKRHQTKTDRFTVVQPSEVGKIMTEFGFNLVHLKTGNARKIERQDHQTTIARYRSNTAMPLLDTRGKALYNDIVFKIPHLYGSIETFLGTWRQICSNGLVVGQKFFEAPRIRHQKNPLEQIKDLIPKIVAKHNELQSLIDSMKSKNVSNERIVEFTKAVAKLRLANTENKIVSVQYGNLLNINRQDDQNTDAFTVLNVVQENIMRNSFTYEVETLDKETNEVKIRNMTARPMMRNERETSRSVDFNSQIWDLAQDILLAS